MKRKTFLKTTSLFTIGSSVIKPSSINFNKLPDDPAVIKPHRLNRGDTVALVAPGSYVSKEEVDESVENLTALGFNVVYSERILLQNGYFSGKDEERSEDLMEKFSDNNVKAIVCARGGYGCSRILPLLDYDVIRKNPKVLIGYSDVTALLYGIYQHSGLITFHGPVGISSYNDFTMNYFNKTLMKPERTLTLINANPTKDENIYGVTTISGGAAKGRLVGGNLSIMVSLIGTKFDVDYSNKLIFIEEIGEEPYRIDRMLTQMIQSGKFENAGGIILGIFDRCEAKEKDPSFSRSFSLMDVLKDRLSKLKIPVVYGMSFGHVKDKFTIPFGLLAEFDADKQQITFLEKAVL